MKLTNEKEISWWAYNQCLKNDTIQMRRLITSSYWIYYYCRFVRDREEMWKKITKSNCAYYYYCRDVKDREEMWRKITESEYSYYYCKEVKDRLEVKKYTIKI